MLLAIGVFLVFYAVYTIITAVANIYLHPLRHIPGPKSWIAFPILKHITAIRGQLDICMRKFHSQYGEAVRFGPDEVSFTTAQAWPDIYGYGSQLPKVLNSSSNRSDILSANDADHSRFRKALSYAFSAKGLQAQEPLLRSYVDKLIERLRGVAESNLPTDLVKWYNLTTFDLIGDLAFGEPFGGLENAEYHHWVSTIFDFVRVIPFIKARDNYPLLFKALMALMPRSLVEAQKRQREHTRITVQKRLSTTNSRDDFMDSMLRDRGEKGSLNQNELEANANILIIAGSETTATLLSGVTYWLLRTPRALQQVTMEVRSTLQAEEDITFSNVSSRLPYLLACINEAFRMYPPVPTGLQRMTPSLTTVDIAGYKIPPKTKVSVHQSAAYLSPVNFHQPQTFIPERWLPETKENPDSPFYHDQRGVLRPFSTGPRDCIGKNLAYNEMRVILARVLWNFDLQLCNESRQWHEQRAFSFWEKGPLMVKLRDRRTGLQQ